MTLITVITVVFNDLEGLKLTIENVRKQTIDSKSIEHLIIDGNSKDGAKEYLETLKISYLNWISEPDKGLYDAMNKGIQYAKGEYICFLNAGDHFVNNDVLSTIESSLKTFPETDFAFGNTIDITPEGEELGLRRLQVSGELNWKSFSTGMKVCHQAMFVRTSISPKYDLQYKISSDFDWSVSVLKASKNILNLNIPIVYFEQGGLSQKRRIQSLKERFWIMSKHYGFLPTLFRHFYFPFRILLFYLKKGRI